MGLCYGSLRAMSAPDLVALAGSNGFNTVMLPVFPQGATTPEAFQALLDQHGITRVVLDGAMGMLPRCGFAEANGMTSAQHFDIAERYRVNCFNVPHYQGDPETSISEFADHLGSFCERAADMDCTVALEFLPGTGIPDMERVVRIVEATGAPNLGMAFDTWHWARLRGTLDDIRALPKGIIKEFQINDRAAHQNDLPDSDQWGRLVPGEGALPLVEIIRAVWDNAPGLPPNVEVFSKDLQAMEPDAAARRIATPLRAIVTQAGSEASR